MLRSDSSGCNWRGENTHFLGFGELQFAFHMGVLRPPAMGLPVRDDVTGLAGALVHLRDVLREEARTTGKVKGLEALRTSSKKTVSIKHEVLGTWTDLQPPRVP